LKISIIILLPYQLETISIIINLLHLRLKTAQ